MGITQISDGFTREDTVPAVGPWGEFPIKYRPALWEESDAYYDAIQKSAGKATAKVKVDFVRSHVAAWGVASQDGGETLPVADAAIKRLPRPQLEHVLRLILGYEGTAESSDVKNS